MERICDACIKHKTMNCPNSSECFCTKDKPHWEDYKMGTKYMAECAVYPYKGYSDFQIQGRFLIPFLIKVFYAARKYQIIDVHYRNF